MKYVFSILIYTLSLIRLQAQTAQTLTAGLTITDEFQRDFLRSRTIAIIDAPAAASTEPAWQAIADEVHPILRNASIDVIAYYELQTLLSGPDATRSFLEDIRSRDVANVVVIDKQAGTTLTVAQLGEEELLSPTGSVWQTTAPSPKEAANELSKAVAAAGLFNQNFLIGEVPEFFSKTDIGFKRRFFSYPLDLKLDRLAVPAYTFTLSGNDSTAALQSVMQAYPYEWGITEPGTEEDNLRLKQGFQFVLLYLHASPNSVRELLEYLPNEDSQPQLQYTGEDQQPVYKFYIRQIANNEVYMGSTWDASPNWEQALRNFWTALRKDQAQ
jgi:hypothetical protein